MKTFATILVGMVSALAPPAASAMEFHVAPTGADANPGTREKPWATLAAARDSIRKLKAAGPLKEPVTVHVHGGTYFLAGPVQFTKEDSGSEATPIVYQAERRGRCASRAGGKLLAGVR